MNKIAHSQVLIFLILFTCDFVIWMVKSDNQKSKKSIHGRLMTPKLGYLVAKMVLSNYIVTSWGETTINPWKLV